MKSLIPIACAACFAFATAVAAEPPREAEVILKEYEAARSPTLDRTKLGDRAYMSEISAASRIATDKRMELALELYRGHAHHPRITELMLARWQGMLGQDSAGADAEIAEFMKDHPGSPVKTDVEFSRAMLAASMSEVLPPDRAEVHMVEDFLKAYPEDVRGADLLLMLTRGRNKSQEQQASLYQRIVAEYPGTRSAKVAAALIRRFDAVGQPFELNFHDAVSGQPVAMKALRGKVVVIDFWATWCGPCIAEMPKMKELYARYKDQGVEFIGVSLDLPGAGLDKLKRYVAENGIPWPQYYQGQGWESEFSTSWGINAIPALFVVDAEGNLHSTEARASLDSLIAELLQKRDRKS